jgi:hypothetical protein
MRKYTLILKPAFFWAEGPPIAGSVGAACELHGSFVGSPRLSPRTPLPQDDKGSVAKARFQRTCGFRLQICFSGLCVELVSLLR